MFSTAKWQIALGIGGLVLLTCVAYLPAMHGGFILDDDTYLTQMPLIKSANGLYRFWFTSEAMDYYPVSNSTLWLEWRLWGMKPTGYHVTNLLLHIVSALLVWRILAQLSIAGGYLAALLFAVHPVNVEGVAWISQRKDVLAVVFFLLSLMWYVRDEESRQEAGAIWRSWYWLSLSAFVLGILSKGSVATLPVVLLGLIAWRRWPNWWDLLRIVPFVLVAAALTLVNISTQHAGVVIRPATFSERLTGAGAAVWFYLGKSLLPIRLIFIYPPWHIRAGELLWWLPVSAAGLATCWLAWLSCRRQAKWPRAILFAWLFFCVTLAPMLGFTDVGFMQYSLVADHYLHLAMIGVAALAAAAWWAWREGSGGSNRSAANVAAAVVVGILTSLTFQQSRLYGDAIALYETTLRDNPESWLMHNNLGVRLEVLGRRQEAMLHFQQAVRAKPDYIEARNNLANELYRMGRADEAIACFQESMRIRPGWIDTYFNLGNVYSELNRPEEAAEQYRQALKLKPDFAEAWANLAATYGDLNRWDDAMAAANNALKYAQAQGLAEVAMGIEAWRNANASKRSQP